MTLIAGTLPGVVMGALLRVYVVPDGAAFRVLVGVLLLGIGAWLFFRVLRPTTTAEHAMTARVADRSLIGLGLAAGLVGGVYGIGGGSLLAPILVGLGYGVAEVAPAALTVTFVTSCGGVIAYFALAVLGHPNASPEWPIAVACGAGGLVGGYLGAALQPRLPARLLTGGIAVVAVGVAIGYLGIGLAGLLSQ